MITLFTILLVIFVLIPVCLVAMTGLGITFFAPVILVGGVIFLLVRLVKKIFGCRKKEKRETVKEIKVED